MDDQAILEAIAVASVGIGDDGTGADISGLLVLESTPQATRPIACVSQGRSM